MQILLVKYIHLVCVTLTFSSKVNCDKLFLINENEDRQIYSTSACSARCLQKYQNMTLENCFNKCKTQSNNDNDDDGTTTTTAQQLKKIYENLELKFLCRDNSSLNFEIVRREFGETNHSDISTLSSSSSSMSLSTATSSLEDHQHVSTDIYVIKVHKAKDPIEQQRLLTNSSFIKLENLLANTTYNISAAVVHPNSQYSLIANNLQLSTLRTKYLPGIVSNISLVKYQENQLNKKHLKGIINWTPASDMTCFYDILFYPSQGSFDFEAMEIRDLKHLYTYTIEPFLFGTVYTIGIRSKNTKDISRESKFEYLSIRTPSCLEWNHNDLTICPPVIPEGLTVVDDVLSINSLAINISWEKPTIEPDFYTVKILDLDLKSESDPNSLTVNVSRDQNFLFIPTITISGHEFEVYLTAFSRGGNSSAMIAVPFKNSQPTDQQHHSFKMIVAIIVALTMLALISMLTFVMCHRRARTKRYKERCKYFEELEKKAPMDPNSNFEFPTSKNPTGDQLTQLQLDLEDKLFFNDEMEIERDDVELFEKLGEGAFGLVRRGNLKISEKNEIEVAVKMLKDHPSVEDFKAFRREIEVMKSVGKHPNLLGLIGHCTRNLNDMLLLTEYCSVGNLLSFLRDEWNYINKIIYIQQNSMSIPNTPIQLPPPSAIRSEQPQPQPQKEHENIFNFDSSFVDKISLKYKNLNDTDQQKTQIETPSKLVVVNNQGYDYNGPCTNFCKCHVDIVSKTVCLKPIIEVADAASNNTTTQKSPPTIYNEIHISNNCECENRVKIINDKNNYCERHLPKINDQQPNNIQKTTTDTSTVGRLDTETDPLVVENQGYYKYIESTVINDQTNQILLNKNNNDEHLFVKQEPLTSSDLLQIAKQIALGMEFLSKCKVVHRDLAARNVLVCQDRTIKIADFGLSRDVYQENVYKKTGNGKLPIKWLALESMTHQVYTTQSDVWSFGILLFEIATLGGTPYPAIATNRLLPLLKTGYRMEKPKNCGQSLYDLMASCWKTAPNERPTFGQICQTLDELLDHSAETQIENLQIPEDDKITKSVSDDSYLNPIL